MKKILATAIAVLIGVAAHAQFYVGGQVGIYHDTGAEMGALTVLPEAGYCLNENMAVGAVVGFTSSWINDVSNDGSFTLQPYFRYSFLEMGPVKFFVDAQLQLEFLSHHNLVTDTRNNDTHFGLGVAPGLSIPLNDNLSFVGHLGQFGYYNEEIIFGVNANNVLCGLYYSF